MNNITDQIRLALHGIWMRRWLALGVAWAICMLGWLIVSMIPNRYESKARIYVQPNNVLGTTVGTSNAESQQSIDRVRETLTSTISLRKVVIGTPLRAQTASEQDVLDQVDQLRKSIKVIEQQDNLFEISASSSRTGLSNAANARLSTAIVQKLIDIFVEENTRGSRKDLSESLRFLDAQISAREKALQTAEDKRAQFEMQHGGTLPGSGTIEQRMAQARSELSQISAQLAAAQSALGSISHQMAGTAPSINTPGTAYAVGGGGGGFGPAHAALQALQSQIASGRAHGWTDNHPDMQALISQLPSARAAAAAESTGGGGGMRTTPGTSTPNPLYMSLSSSRADKQAAVAELGARKSQLESQLAQVSAQQTAEPGVTAELSRLNRDYDVLKQQYDHLVGQREEMRVRADAGTSTDAVKFRVIDPPAFPRSPATPNRPMLLIGVLLAGLLGGLAAAFGRSKFQTTYATSNHLAKASGLPVIGSVSRVVTVEQKADEARRLRWFQGAFAALGGIFILLLLIEFIERSMVA